MVTTLLAGLLWLYKLAALLALILQLTCEIWLMSPLSSLAAQVPQEPDLQLYGKSNPASSAASRIAVLSSHCIVFFPSGVTKVTSNAMHL